MLLNHPHCFQQVLFRETSPQQIESFSYTVTGLRPWTKYEFSVCTHNPAGHTCSPWVTVTTRQAPPRAIAPPKVSHLRGRPSEVLVSWSPPLEPNGVLQSYRIQRNNISFSFSFDPTVLSYTDEDLLPYTTYRYCLLLLILFSCFGNLFIPNSVTDESFSNEKNKLDLFCFQLLGHSLHI